MIRIVEFDWYWGRGRGVEETVAGAIEWYNSRYGQPANFVQLCDEDLERLNGGMRGRSGALWGVTVYRGGNGEESGNVMVGRVERC